MHAREPSTMAFGFGPFRLDPAERLLLRDGEPVPLRPKLFDTLHLLVQRAGRLVERQELIDRVWPDAIVEEGNLSHNVSALRRALGDGDDARFIETVPKRGYRFIHPVSTSLASVTATDVPAEPGLERARRALAQGAYRDAYRWFCVAEQAGDLPATDQEGLAEAARWSGHADRLVPLLESAAEAHRRGGDGAAAARCALELAIVMLDRGRPTLARSYLRQAERYLADVTDPGAVAARRARVLGRLEWLDGCWQAALTHTETAVAVARAHGDADTETVALVECALSLIALRRYAEAIPPLDEAGAGLTTGKLGAQAIGLTLCGLITGWRACGRIDRATEWLEASIRWVDGEEVSLYPGMCRVHRGELCGLRGDLAEAEADLQRGTDELLAAESALAGMGMRELGIVRLRRGDLTGAEQAFCRAMEFGFDPQPGLAQLRAARGEPDLARRDLERFLAEEADGPHSILDRENRFAAVAAFVSLAAATGSPERAQRALDELEASAAATGSPMHRAMVAAAAGDVALAAGRIGDAVTLLQRGWRGFTEVAAPYEAAAARMRLGEALLRDGDATRAHMELAGAAAAFARIGAELDRGRVARLLASLGHDAGRRQRVVAYGEIADAQRLRELVGETGWADLTNWLTRRLTSCWRDHGGRELHIQDGRYMVEFADRRSCLACIEHVHRSLREHRARQGFAPTLRVGIACEADAAGIAALDDAGLLDLAQRLAQLCAAGEVAIVGDRPPGAARTAAVPDSPFVAHLVAVGDAGTVAGADAMP